MFRNVLHRRMISLGFVLVAASLPWATTSTSAVAQCAGHGGMGGHNHASAGNDSHDMHSEPQHHLPNGGLPTLVPRTPHGGRFLDAGLYGLEVVYLPRETRVYLFGRSMEPLSTQTLQAQMSPHARGESSPQHILLQHVPSSGPKDQDYLAAAVDMTQLPDETPISFRFEKLPDRRHSKAEFAPIFHPSEIRPDVVRVSFVQADREGLTRQKTCSVTGALLGSMGEPIKVLVGDRPLYLCCDGCIERVKKAPYPCCPSKRGQ